MCHPLDWRQSPALEIPTIGIAICRSELNKPMEILCLLQPVSKSPIKPSWPLPRSISMRPFGKTQNYSNTRGCVVPIGFKQKIILQGLIQGIWQTLERLKRVGPPLKWLTSNRNQWNQWNHSLRRIIRVACPSIESLSFNRLLWRIQEFLKSRRDGLSQDAAMRIGLTIYIKFCQP
jgi:hypothetical protein